MGRMGITRRATLAGAVGTVASGATGGWAATPTALQGGFADLERRTGGRLGVAVWDLGSRARAGYKADERFPFCSTFKVPLVGCVLARIDRGDEDAERRVRFAPDDLVAYSPVTRDRTHGEGMGIGELCAAAVSRGDNSAANLLLASVGGPPGLTAWLRGIGDDVTRSDRIETGLNEGGFDDPRDTTSPRAMVDDLQRLLFGDVLKQAAQDRLAAWMVANDTGGRRARAGLPKEWRIGDRTGTGGNGAASTIAVAWPPGRAPLLLAVYLHGSKAAPAELDVAIASACRLAATLG